MPVALGADWLPSGSTSLLAELKIARRELARQGLTLPAADLVHRITAGAATVAGLDTHLGSLAAGRPADLIVLERHHADPYDNVSSPTPPGSTSSSSAATSPTPAPTGSPPLPPRTPGPPSKTSPPGANP